MNKILGPYNLRTLQPYRFPLIVTCHRKSSNCKTQIAGCALSWEDLNGSLLISCSRADLSDQQVKHHGMVKEGSVCAHPLCTHHLYPCHAIHTSYGGASEECPLDKTKIVPPNIFKHQYICKYLFSD